MCYDNLESQPGSKYAEGSWWQAFNSVTFVTDHLQGRSADNRLYSNWYGNNQARKRDALKKARKELIKSGKIKDPKSFSSFAPKKGTPLYKRAREIYDA